MKLSKLESNSLLAIISAITGTTQSDEIPALEFIDTEFTLCIKFEFAQDDGFEELLAEQDFSIEYTAGSYIIGL